MRNRLINEGKRELRWARLNMPILAIIRNEFRRAKPLKGINIGVCLHLEKKTGVLLETLKEGGAEISACSCNPLTTDDRVAEALKEKMHIYARAGQTNKEYYTNINKVLEHHPHIVIDDGGDLIFTLHKGKKLLKEIMGGCEETTTGVLRLKSMEKDKALKIPVFAVNNAYSKFLFDNRFGTGQSVIDALMRATNKLIAGKNVVVIGYGWCGKGIAERLRGMGANVIVVEVGERMGGEGPSGYHKGLEALYAGFRVMNMEKAAKEGDIFITATGGKNVIGKEHFELMKDGAILANAGHFNVEIDLVSLSKIAKRKEIKENITEYVINHKRIYVLSEGRLVNLAQPSGQGHPIEIMDGSFALQALCVKYIVENAEKLENIVYNVPMEIDDRVAELALLSQNIKLDRLSKEQKMYLEGWKEGT